MLLAERHKDLQDLGVKTIGISADHLPALRVFHASHSGFPFPLAADWHRGICRAYGVLNEESQVARRALVLCDGDGQVRDVIDDFDPRTQMDRFDQMMETARALH